MVSFGKILNHCIDFLFPPCCVMCGEKVSENGLLCETCWASFNWIDGEKCCKCGYPLLFGYERLESMMCPVCASGQCELDWIRSACVYDEASKNVMLPFKHCGKTEYYKFMSNAMLWALRDVDLSDIDLIIPVPLAWRRLFHRGYNQSVLLARPISKALGIKLDLGSLHRKYRPDMGHKNSVQRAKNISGVFTVVHPERLRDKNILLVDDVMTSGATFKELRKVLLKSGVRSVCGVTFCRVVRAR
ncbi:MAG: ComF family protein [Alphaproteobacteria bacterium]